MNIYHIYEGHCDGSQDLWMGVDLDEAIFKFVYFSELLVSFKKQQEDKNRFEMDLSFLLSKICSIMCLPKKESSEKYYKALHDIKRKEEDYGYVMNSSEFPEELRRHGKRKDDDLLSRAIRLQSDLFWDIVNGEEFNFEKYISHLYVDIFRFDTLGSYISLQYFDGGKFNDGNHLLPEKYKRV